MQDALADIRAHPLAEDKVPRAFQHILPLFQPLPPAAASNKPGANAAADAAAAATVQWKWDLLREAK